MGEADVGFVASGNTAESAIVRVGVIEFERYGQKPIVEMPVAISERAIGSTPTMQHTARKIFAAVGMNVDVIESIGGQRFSCDIIRRSTV